MTADVDLLPCPFCGSAEPIVAEPPEILPLSFQIICSGSGCNAVVESRTLARAKLMWNRRANVAQQHGQAKDCHCATCTCAPGMTPAVRFDTSPAAQEGAVRDHLIALGWTPPGAQQPAAVDEAAAIRAFEEHFQASSDDPYFEGELELWITAWRKALAAQQQGGSDDA